MRKRPLTIEPATQVFARHQLHDQIGAPVGLARLAHRHDAWVIEPADDLSLAQKSSAGGAIGGELGKELLERDQLAGRRVTRPPDLGDAAAAEELTQLEPPRHGRHVCPSSSPWRSAVTSRSASSSTVSAATSWVTRSIS